jgi:hypothetical protein
MTRSKVLVLGLNYAPCHTGIAPYTAGMAEGLSRDYDVRVVAAHPHYPDWKIADGYGPWRPDDRVANIPVRRLRHYVPANPTGPTRVLSEVTFAARALASGVTRPDVIITVSPALLPVAWRPCSRGVPESEFMNVLAAEGSAQRRGVGSWGSETVVLHARDSSTSSTRPRWPTAPTIGCGSS